MNRLKIGLIAVVFNTSLLYPTETINEKIEAIHKAPIQARAELMNKLKIELASMNEEERANAISALRSDMGGKVITSGITPTSQRMQQMPSTQQGSLMQRTGNTLNAQFPRIRR